jgi:hypothetical protein
VKICVLTGGASYVRMEWEILEDRVSRSIHQKRHGHDSLLDVGAAFVPAARRDSEVDSAAFVYRDE